MAKSSSTATATDIKSTKSSNLNIYHVTTGLLLVFAAAHTIGGLLTEFDLGPEPNAAMLAMKTAHFQFFGFNRTFYDFYFGFGLMATLFLLLSAALSWTISQAPRNSTLGSIKWWLFISQALTMVLAWTYFFTQPVVVSTLITLLLGYGCL